MCDDQFHAQASSVRALSFVGDCSHKFSDVTHEQEGFVIAIERGSPAVLNRNRKLESTVRLVPKLSIPIELKMDLALDVFAQIVHLQTLNPNCG